MASLSVDHRDAPFIRHWLEVVLSNDGTSPRGQRATGYEESYRSTEERGAVSGPHQDQPVATAGASLESATAAVILLHGRGASAESILGMSGEFDSDAVAYLAPQAARREWYPQSFLAPVEANEPGRSSGLEAIADLLEAATGADIPSHRVLIGGFSQGACLASEFVARTPRRYGGLAALSGGLIGEAIDGALYAGDLEGTPAFLGCSDVDPHIPAERVQETAAVLDDLGADVRTRIYEGMGHTVNQDELEHLDGMIGALADR
jgi:phospholipase/carboxylesterase